jgi:malate dehydrogenase (oxaloacetate-decarboxylating)(NADP+)
MAEKPLVFALANPVPEILPEEIRAVRTDAIIATGRTDYPNQVNNVLCFPFLFRGALDVGATTINEEMKRAAVEALAGIARAEASDIVMSAYGADTFRFGPDYIIPKPFDPRLIVEIASAVARAAMASGVATRPIADFSAYRDKLSRLVYRSGLFMKPVLDAAKRAPKRLVFADGEHPYVLQAAQQLVSEGLARPILIGRKKEIAHLLNHLGLKIRAGKDFDLFDPGEDKRIPAIADQYHRLVERKGTSPSEAQRIARTNPTVIAAMLLKRGEADAAICGAVGRFERHLAHVDSIIGRREGVSQLGTMSAMILPTGTLFLADTYVNYDPSAWQLADIAVLAAEQIKRFGVVPKVALISHSNFGASDYESAAKMRHVLDLVRQRAPELDIEGEMKADAALSTFIREEVFPNSRLKGAANLLIMPGLDAANIAFNMLKVLGNGVAVSPILLGAASPIHIVTPSITVRGLFNMSALAVVDAGRAEADASAATKQ